MIVFNVELESILQCRHRVVMKCGSPVEVDLCGDWWRASLIYSALLELWANTRLKNWADNSKLAIRQSLFRRET
jgi:hypothetical protein